MVLLGANPYQSQSTSCGKCVELYEMCSNPKARDNRMAKKKKLIVFGFDMEGSSPYQGHTNNIYCANHVDNFSKQMIHSYPHQHHHF